MAAAGTATTVRETSSTGTSVFNNASGGDPGNHRRQLGERSHRVPRSRGSEEPDLLIHRRGCHADTKVHGQ